MPVLVGPRGPAALGAGLCTALVLTGCATQVTTVQQVSVRPIPLPPGALSGLVLQPAQAPSGSVPLLQATGPASQAQIASFSADPPATAAALTARGFEAAYVVEYGDTSTGTSLDVTVVQFASPVGADAQLTADLASPLPVGATHPAVGPIGDRSAVVSQPLPGGRPGAQLVTARFRVGRLDYLVAATAPGQVDPVNVDTIATVVASRAQASPLSAG